MKTFYQRVVARLVAEGKLTRSTRVLVVCGGPQDRAVLLEAGLQEVTVSNLDDRLAGASFAPFKWSLQDAERLTFADGEFDVAVVHAGLHHCRCPHRALLEMYRVARDGILVLEARDSLAVRWACRLGFALDYEVTAAAEEGWDHGGVNNSGVPNYVYRWTEREVFKTLASYNPEGRLSIRFFHGMDLHYGFVALTSRARAAALRVLSPVLSLLTWLFPSQANCFAFWVTKPRYPGDLQPWLTMAGGELVPKAARGQPASGPP
jgi:ubiquinone/menaquinone biosynthesis C-methylase UbiE